MSRQRVPEMSRPKSASTWGLWRCYQSSNSCSRFSFSLRVSFFTFSRSLNTFSSWVCLVSTRGLLKLICFLMVCCDWNLLIVDSCFFFNRFASFWCCYSARLSISCSFCTCLLSNKAIWWVFSLFSMFSLFSKLNISLFSFPLLFLFLKLCNPYFLSTYWSI